MNAASLKAPRPEGAAEGKTRSRPVLFVLDDDIKRVASAVGDGATVVRHVHEYLTAGYEEEPELPLAARSGA